MTDLVFVALIAGGSAVFGALVGGLVSIVAAWIRAREERRQTRSRLAVEAAMEEYRMRARARPGVVPPLGVLIFAYARMLDAIDEGAFDRERMEEINALSQELIDYSELTGGDGT